MTNNLQEIELSIQFSICCIIKRKPKPFYLLHNFKLKNHFYPFSYQISSYGVFYFSVLLFNLEKIVEFIELLLILIKKILKLYIYNNNVFNIFNNI